MSHDKEENSETIKRKERKEERTGRRVGDEICHRYLATSRCNCRLGKHVCRERLIYLNEQRTRK